MICISLTKDYVLPNTIVIQELAKAIDERDKCKRELSNLQMKQFTNDQKQFHDMETEHNNNEVHEVYITISYNAYAQKCDVTCNIFRRKN